MSTLLPEILAEHRDPAAPQRVVLDLRVPADLAYFPGHFPGLPILPGVVQIDWAVKLGRRYLACAGEFSALENVKFQALTLPEARLELTLAWDAAKSRLAFAYTSAARKHSSGRIVFAGGAGDAAHPAEGNLPPSGTTDDGRGEAG